MSDLTERYLGMWKEAARTVDARITEISRGVWRVERGAQSTLIHNYVVQIDDPVVLNLAGDKALCHRILMDQGLPVPEHEVYTLGEFNRAEAFTANHPEACFVVKPATGTSGARGVTTHLRTARECRRASVLASLYGDRILIERWVPGESYRLLVLDGEMIHASRRRGRRVVGDGKSTVRELLGSGRDSRTVGFHRSSLMERDLVGTLVAQELRLDSVPDAGRSVLVQSAYPPLSKKVEVRTVFDEDATEQIGAELRTEATRAVQALGSSFAGVDVITLDPRLSLTRSGGVINEINTTPGLHHHYGLTGVRAEVTPAVRVLERLLEVNVGADRALASANRYVTVGKPHPAEAAVQRGRR